jgi:phosphocarrier protein HPr
MKKDQYTIMFPEGFHARPASEFVSKAKQYTSTVTLIKENKEVDGKSLIQIMTLGIKEGDLVEVQIEGEDEQEAYIVLHDFFGGDR